MKRHVGILSALFIGLCICTSGCIGKQVEKAIVHDMKKVGVQQAGWATLDIDERYVLKDIYLQEGAGVVSLYYDDTEGKEGLAHIEVEESDKDCESALRNYSTAIKLNDDAKDDYMNTLALNILQNYTSARKLVVDISKNMELEAKEYKGNAAIVLKGYSEKYGVSLVYSFGAESEYIKSVLVLKRDTLDNTYNDAKKVISSILYNGKVPDIEFEDYDESEISIEGFLNNSVIAVDGDEPAETFNFDSDLKSIGDMD